MADSRRLLLIHSGFSLLIAAWLLCSPSLSFHFVSEPKTWEDARSYCRERNSDLATPDDMEEMSRLQQSVKPKHQGDVWIGLRGGSHQRWLWSGNTNLQYTHWQPRQPSGSEICGQSISAKGWFTRYCGGVWWFLCNTENNSPKYVMIRTTKSWIDAQSYCREYYIDLAVMENREDEELIWNVSEGHPVWIGLFKDSWEWVDQGNSSFRYWASETEMASTGDDCVVVRTTEGGRWYRHTCSVKHPFVCQQPRKKMQFVRLIVSVKEGVNLNDPNLKAAMLEQITANLKKQPLLDGANLEWLENEDGQVFVNMNEKRKMRRMRGDGEL